MGMHPDIAKLLQLQAKDIALLEADRALDVVLAEIEALDQQLAEQGAAVERARLQVADTTRRRAEVDEKIANYRKLEERGKLRLESVKVPRELQAVNTELDLARSILAKEEGEWLRLSEQLSLQEKALGEAERQLAEFRESQDAARSEIRSRQEEAEASRLAALADRDAAAGEVERALRTRYERLRSNKSVGVVVALAGAACGACYTTVPLNRRSQIRAGTLIEFCESCGVILYSADGVD
jgi:predicted  nucleic acid-binding Zn-ribbon protein